jgi:very-short-patch-repair endonuclease
MSLERTRGLNRRESVAARLLWSALRNRQVGGAKFRRQVVIGSFMVDFACFEHRIAIELDGGEPAERTAHDLRRPELLAAQGYRLLRISNNDVMRNMAGVVEIIEAELKK